MPRYFIDAHDGATSTTDDEGQERPDIPALRALVRRTLGSLVAHDTRDQAHTTFSVVVRNEHGETVLESRIAITMAGSE